LAANPLGYIEQASAIIPLMERFSQSLAGYLGYLEEMQELEG
jgi:hypothetical protein